MSVSTANHHASTASRAAKNGKSSPAKSSPANASNGAAAVRGNASPLKRNGKTSWFTAFAQKTAHLAGKPAAFMLAAATIVVWAVTGPLFGYSDTWQLVINTGTTIITFLMVFLIQNSQNRDSLAFQVKLDELIIKLHGAGNEIAGAEDLCDEDLEKLHETYRKRAAHAHDTLEKRRSKSK
jgi:low affinity Fe/Cu permease